MLAFRVEGLGFMAYPKWGLYGSGLRDEGSALRLGD